jgi:hypothetical protein
MPAVAPPSIWTNPLQRFGYLDVNVLIGDGIEDPDKDLFFGPVRRHDQFVVIPACASVPRLLAGLGFYGSAKEAERHGHAGRIPDGFTDFLVRQWGRKHRVCVLSIASKGLGQK